MRTFPWAPATLLHETECIAQDTIGDISLGKAVLISIFLDPPNSRIKFKRNLATDIKLTFCISSQFYQLSLVLVQSGRVGFVITEIQISFIN